MSALEEATERNRAMWEAGDWDAVAPKIAPLGLRLVDRIDEIAPGVRLLDIGTGSGGAVAIPAAQRGADVVAVDITDAWFGAARRRAEEAGVEVEWVVGDAAELPFEDGGFDVVLSSLGHMFAPDRHAAARELVRVCRPGGTIGCTCWTPDGHFGRIFRTIAAALSESSESLSWGSEPHVRKLLEPLGVTLEARCEMLTIEAPAPEMQLMFWEATFAPVVMAKAALGDERWPGLRAELLALLHEINERDDGSMAADYEYLETIGRTAEA